MQSIEGNPEKRAIVKENAIKSGSSHREAYIALFNNFRNKTKFFKILAKTPNKTARTKYNIWRYLLALLLLAILSMITVEIIQQQHFSSLLTSIYVC